MNITVLPSLNYAHGTHAVLSKKYHKTSKPTLNELKTAIGRYFNLIDTLNISDENKAKGKERLGQFLKNVEIINKINPEFAHASAEHKLYVLDDFKQYHNISTNLTGYFKEAFYGSFNLGIVGGSGVLRNSQPCQKDLIWLIKNMGIKTIVNLRKEYKYWEGYNKSDEEAISKKLGIECKNFLLEDNDNPPPSKIEIEEVLNFIDACKKPVMIHCAAGRGRTGIVAAAYRITRQGWKSKDAITEAMHYGFDPDKNPNQVKLIRSFSS